MHRSLSIPNALPDFTVNALTPYFFAKALVTLRSLCRSGVKLVGRRLEELLLRADELLLGHAALLDLGLLLLAVLRALAYGHIDCLCRQTCCCFL